MHIGSTVRGEIRRRSRRIGRNRGRTSGGHAVRRAQDHAPASLSASWRTTSGGIYGGAIGYIDFTGNMDTCIAIRIAYKKNGKVFVRSGAGIVADSVPEKRIRGMP